MYTIVAAFAFLTAQRIWSEKVPHSIGVENSPLSNVSALLGSRSSLPCDVSPIIPNDRPILVLYYKGDTGTPIYSIDAREGEFDHGSQWVDEEVIGSRAHFDISSHPVGLVLDPVQLEDSALYRCRVDFKSSPTRNVRILLEVVDPVTRVEIKNEAHQTVEGAIGPFAIGSKVVLRCDVVGGHPKPMVTWSSNGVVVDDESEVFRENTISNFLTHRNLTRKDLFKQYTCKASNSNFTASISSSVTIDMIFPPLELHLDGGEPSQREGTVTNFMCETKGSRPPAEITWWKGGVSIGNAVSKTYNNGNVTRSTLALVIRMEDDKKRIVCRAQNPILPSAVLESSKKLNVLYAPRPILTPGMNLNIEEIKEGDDLFFECEIKANPKATNIQWYFNEETRLEHNVSCGIIKSNQSLVLQKVGREATGSYTCVAKNKYGRGVSNPIKLRVKFSPICVDSTPKVFGAEKNEKMSVSCEIFSDPPANKFQWAFNTSSEIVDMTWFKGHKGPEVSYTPRSDLDFGSLLCWASNEVGTQKVPCVIHVIHAGIPAAVKNCSVTNVSSTSASIECLPGWDGGLEQSFTIQVLEEMDADTTNEDILQYIKEENEEDVKKVKIDDDNKNDTPVEGSVTNDEEVVAQGLKPILTEEKQIPTEKGAPVVLANTASSPNPLFVVEGLKAEKRYLVSIRSVNAKGQSDATFLRIFTNSEEQLKRVLQDSEIKPPVKMTPLIATALGVFGAFSIVFLILITALWVRRTHLRRRERNRSKGEFIPEGGTASSSETDKEVHRQNEAFSTEEVDNDAPDIIPLSKEGTPPSKLPSQFFRETSSKFKNFQEKFSPFEPLQQEVLPSSTEWALEMNPPPPPAKGFSPSYDSNQEHIGDILPPFQEPFPISTGTDAKYTHGMLHSGVAKSFDPPKPLLESSLVLLPPVGGVNINNLTTNVHNIISLPEKERSTPGERDLRRMSLHHLPDCKQARKQSSEEEKLRTEL